MSKQAIFLGALLALGTWHLSAQSEQRRQATITGRGGSPKCTIEVEVDGVADVEIRGAAGRLHTLSGTPSVWRRFECNQPMPPNPGNFQFRGIDGRGRQTLIGDPRGSGAAVVRIEDPASGREGYTFDLEWEGSAGPGRGPGYPSGSSGQWPGDDRGPGGGFGGGFNPRDAIRACGDQASDELRRRGYVDSRITNADMDNQPGHNDWISGNLTARRGPRVDNFSFACPIDFRARRVGAVSVRPSGDGYYGRDNVGSRFSREQAIRACGDAVRDRMSRDGYGDVRMGRIDLDNRPGNKDWVVGDLNARRGGYSDRFEFSCSVDFDGGRVRSINVDRR